MSDQICWLAYRINSMIRSRALNVHHKTIYILFIILDMDPGLAKKKIMITFCIEKYKFLKMGIICVFYFFKYFYVFRIWYIPTVEDWIKP